MPEHLLPEEKNPNFDHEFAKTHIDRIHIQDENQGPNTDFMEMFEALDEVVEQANEPKVRIIEDGT